MLEQLGRQAKEASVVLAQASMNDKTSCSGKRQTSL